jgi:hypothetical protein
MNKTKSNTAELNLDVLRKLLSYTGNSNQCRRVDLRSLMYIHTLSYISIRLYIYFSRFRVSFNFNLLGDILLPSSLGAGLGKRTWKPLGAHQEFRREFWFVQPNYLSCIGNLTPLDLFTSMHCLIICVVSLLSFISSFLRSTRQEDL